MGIADRRIDYETQGLDVGDLHPDPLAQWWQWYDEAVAAGVTEPEAMVVSTVGIDGVPDSRYVLVRGVDERGFGFYTNLASAKGTQIASHALACCVFGWLQLHRQVRVRGRVVRIPGVEADAYFGSRPRGSQIGAWASAQSTVIADRAELEAKVAEVERRFEDAEVARPPFWGGYRVVPTEIEFWQGRPSRLHDRLRYRHTEDGPSAWVIERLSP
jgi:pyridoxamine 5'-phosphate oxidase